MAKYKVLVSDSISSQGVRLLEAEPEIDVDVKVGMKPDELKACIGDYHGLIVRSATKVTREIIEAADNLKVVGRAGTGVDNIDIEAATEKGIVVMNTPGGNTVAAAEHAISMMLAAARKIPQAHSKLKAGKWDKKSFMGIEVHNKVLGVVGMGRIGSLVCEMAQGLGMSVIAYDPYLSHDGAKKMGVTLVDLDELFSQADFISIHAPATPETKNLINADAFSKMKDGAVLVNCARGGIVDEDALYDALKSGKLAAAALDVFAQEPLPADSPLLELDNLVVTPHLGASTREAQEVVAVAIVHQIIEYLTKGIIKNAVNVPSIKPELVGKAEPYLNLVEKLGSFVSQISKGRMDELVVEYSGEVVEEEITPALTLAALTGILSPILGSEGVNMVSAPIIAKNRGIKVSEVKSRRSEGYVSLIRITLKGNGEETSVAGTLIKEDAPRIVMVNRFPIEAEPSGYMLYFKNYDRPGVIGRLGTILGDAGVNIAGFRLGRVHSGELAVALLNVDQPIDQEVLDKIRELPNIIDAILVSL